MMSQDHYARHGGVHFVQHASNQEVNEYISRMPNAERDSLFEVLDQLDKAGLISIVNDGQFADGNGKLGGTEGCYEEGDR